MKKEISETAEYLPESILKDKFYINQIKMNTTIYANDKITFTFLMELIQLIASGKELPLELTNTDTDLSMNIFAGQGYAQIGIVDMYNDIIHFYDNRSGSSKLLTIGSGVYEEWMVCKEIS